MVKQSSGGNVQGFIPLRVNGKLDSRRRAVNTSTGEIISLRQYQKLQKQTASSQTSQPAQTAQSTQKPKRTPQKSITKKQSQGSSPVVAQAKVSHSRDYYKQQVGIFMDARNKQLANSGLPLYTKRSDVIRSQEFKAYYQAIKPPSKSMSDAQKKKWNDPKGKKAQALVNLGLRSPEADYPVGETPDVY